MASHGIKDRVAIIGMGCTPFKEHWDKGTDDLIIDAAQRHAAPRPACTKDDVDAYWLGTAQSGMTGVTLARTAPAAEQARHPGRELLRHGLRGAAPGLLRRGLGRLRRGGGGRRREGQGRRATRASTRPPIPTDGTHRTLTAAAHVLHGRPGLRPEVRRPSPPSCVARLARIAPKNHYNGAQQPPRPVPPRDVASTRSARCPRSPATSSVFDCAGVADGAAAAIVCRAEDAHKYTDKPIFVKALAFVAGNGSGRAPTRPTTTPTSTEMRGRRQGRLRPGRDHRSPRRAGDGRGARLLHPHRAGAHGGPGLRERGKAWRRRRGRRARPARRPAGQHRRRAPSPSATRSAPRACA